MSLDDEIERFKEGRAAKAAANAAAAERRSQEMQRLASRIDTELIQPFLEKINNRSAKRLLRRDTSVNARFSYIGRRRHWVAGLVKVTVDGDWEYVFATHYSSDGAIVVNRSTMRSGEAHTRVGDSPDSIFGAIASSLTQYLTDHNLA